MLIYFYFCCINISFLLRPAADIAEAVMKEVRQEGDHGLPKLDNLTRAVNLSRRNIRLKESQSKDFEVI